MTVLFGLVSVVVLFALMSVQAAGSVWAISYMLIASLWVLYAPIALGSKIFLALWGLAIISINSRPFRRAVFSRFLFNKLRHTMPTMSVTEKEALAAGTVTWESELFSGSPNFDSLLLHPTVSLTSEEHAFIDGPLKQLCRMLNDWDITHKNYDLSEEVWQFIKDSGFFGMIIPKQYGGLAFSATAQAAILAQVYSCSITAATTISVPNSLGPAELLLKYGTTKQKDYYLPRLAKGLEIPCFALTSPDAGSDAASIQDRGVVTKRTVNSQDVIGILLNWNKRYITLCPKATVIGLAFQLYDPNSLLGGEAYLGITCALIPATTPGVVHGRRHFPLNTAFLNGPTQGVDVFIPLDYLIGGAKLAGCGWGMLMECLSAGRAISLPSSALGGGQAAVLACGAYSRVRRQFNQPIANFEGIEEPLARIAGNSYIIDSALAMTVAAIDNGEKPAVAGAILKYHATEKARQIANDAMDIHGGKGVCLGPNNYLGRAYQSAPISITVEGANILTRSLIIFGQGAIRCHPYVFTELESIRSNDLEKFDKAIWSHIGLICANFSKTILFACTLGYGTKTPKSSVSRYYQLIHTYSTKFAFLTEVSMIFLGGQLKRKEKISARLGDMLSYLYLAAAVLKRYHDDGEPKDEKILVDWCCQQLLFDCENAMLGILANFPLRAIRIILVIMLHPLVPTVSKPRDKLGQRLAQLISTVNTVRSKLTRFVFIESIENCPLGRLEEAFKTLQSVEEVEQSVLLYAKKSGIQSLSFNEKIAHALQANHLTLAESAALVNAEKLRQSVIMVDSFTDAELKNNTRAEAGTPL